MHASLIRLSAGASRAGKWGAAVATSLAVCALPAALVAPAGAQAAVAPAVAQPVSVSPLAPGEVEEVLDSIPLKDIPSTRLSDTLAQLPGLSALPEGSLQAGLKNAIEQLAGKGDTLGQLLGSGELASKLQAQLLSLLTLEQLADLPALLKGHTLSSVLSDALGSVAARQLLAELLASAGAPEQLIEQVLGASNPESLQALLGSTLAGEPFTKGTVEEVAQSAGTTAEGLASDLDTTSSQLPAGAMALTAPLSDGKTLSVLDALDGLDLGLLGPAQEGPEGAGGGSGGSSGGGSGGTGGGASGGNGGSGSGGSAGGPGGSGGTGDGSSTAPAGMTLVVDEPAGAGSTARPGATVAKVAILKRRVRRDVVTLIVRVPAAGRLTITGKGVRSVSRQADKAERVTVRVTLTRAAAALLRTHRRSIRLKLDAHFASTGGSSSKASTAVTLG
jgi:hypothetical protein